jgi:cytochrome c biogenesis protein CcmG, thiol:disulfide interchange protein DsbE
MRAGEGREPGPGPHGTREALASMAVIPLRWTRGRIVSFAVTVLLAAALLAVLWVRLLTANQAVQSVTASPLAGHRAPDFTLTVYNGAPGQTIHLADLRGKPVVINFWASWCVPCSEEAPILEAAWQKHRNDGVVFIGVDYDDKADPARAFLQQHGITYATGPDDANGAIAIAYGVSGTPETAFVDRNGIVTVKWGGAIDDRTLEQNIQRLLRT